MLSANPKALGVLLRKLESIGSLSADERQSVLSLPVRTQLILSRQDILREGDEPSCCCLILDGWACRYKLIGEGRRQILSFHVAGDILNLQTLHLPSMNHSLGTLTKASIAFIPHEALHDRAIRFPSIAALLWRDTLIDAAIFQEWLLGLGRRSAYERIAHLFCEMYLKLEAVGLAEEHCCSMPLTQSDLADALGLSTVHVNRVLQTMRGHGLITLKASSLVIEAWEQLIQAGEFDPAYLHLKQRAAGRAVEIESFADELRVPH